MVLFIVVPALLSLIFNQYAEVDVGSIVVIICYAIIANIVIRFDSGKDFSNFMLLLSVSLLFSILIAFQIISEISLLNISVLVAERRAALGIDSLLHPNFIGLVCMVMAITALGTGRPRLAGALFFTAVFISWIVSSRAAILGIAAAAFIAVFLKLLMSRPRNPDQVILLTSAFFLLLTAGVMFAHSQAVDFVLEDVLLVYDDARGLQSGFSDRTVIWNTALDLWLQNPIFGVGFGQHVERMQIETYAHNMVLVLLSETGLVGLVGFILFSLVTLANGFRLIADGNTHAGRFVIMVLIVYWVYGIFEGRAVSAGNPLSALFFLISFASTQALLRRAPPSFRQARRHSGSGDVSGGAIPVKNGRAP